MRNARFPLCSHPGLPSRRVLLTVLGFLWMPCLAALPAGAVPTPPPSEAPSADDPVTENDVSSDEPAPIVALRDPAPTTDPMSALQEGNRLFEAGELEAAATAYHSGYDPRSPHPTLTYNLATALHHAGRLPEAILWYRRGADDDPWAEENLWLARKSLGSQTLPLTGPSGWVARHGSRLADGLIAWLWLACLAALLLPENRSKAAWIAALVGLLGYAGLAVAHGRSPEPVVLLEDCATRSGELPAGTEAWASRIAEGWRVTGVAEGICPERAVGPVNP